MTTAMTDRLRRALPAILGLVLFAIALEVLHVELRTVSWRDLTLDIRHTPPSHLVVAAILTVLNYAVLTGYDFLGFAYIGKRLPARKIARTAFLAYAIANTIGGLALAGFSVRYRFYTRRGVTVEELSRLALSYSLTFWLGLLALGGLSLALDPLSSPPGLPTPGLIRLVGWLLVAVPVAYLVAAKVRQTPLRLWRFDVPLPSLRLGAAQLALSSVEWTLFAAVLYVLLPASQLSFLGFLGAFLAATVLGLASHVPGGVGVFEGLMVVFLHPFLTTEQLLPALVVFRAIYYLIPLAVALVLLLVDELGQPRSSVAQVGGVLGPLTEQLTPRVLAALTFLVGVVLLLSGAIPASPGRLSWIQRVLPLAVVESSHFLGSVAGAVLLVISQGLSRRLDGAYYFAVGTIVAGAVASILKGLDFEEAVLLVGVLLVLRRARPAFYRRTAFFDARPSPDRIAATVAALAASIWLGLFAHQHVAYSHELWWQFAFGAEASRFLRASVGAALVMLVFGVARLVAPAPHEAALPDEAELDAARLVIGKQSSTMPSLVYLRDKALLFNDDRTGFIMYGVEGRTWVALGDPVGPTEVVSDLIRRFLERCDDFDGTPVFYEVAKEYLHHYADFGLAFVKLGERACVDLRAFTLEGPGAAKFRKAIARLEKEGATFRVIDTEALPAMMGDLRRVSDDWLKEKAGAEKRFSLGYFDEAYLSRFPVAVVERGGRVVAFANMWLGSHGGEISVDLMRYCHDAPKSVMEALFVHLFGWGRAQGYHWFALGMAPLSGFEHSPVAPLWSRVGSFLYEHGEALYRFQGLRDYKEKFNPVWEPRYLVYPGGLRLPRILADVSALIAGGYHRIFVK
jgi:phosphatidylglycerol lysyltransferase